MLVTRELVERLEAVETETVVRLVDALARTAADPVTEWQAFGRGALVATGAGRYVNRAVGTTVDGLSVGRVAELVDFYQVRGLPPAVQLCSWAPGQTVDSLRHHGFLPVSSRSVLAGRVQELGDSARAALGLRVIEVDDRTAAAARDVMASEAGTDRMTSDEFMTADRAGEGTTQLVALLHDEPVGCGSVTVVGRTAWLGAAATVPTARRRGVQAALVRHRLRTVRGYGCDLVGATASTGSTSARNLQRLGFVLVQDQWVVQQAPARGAAAAAVAGRPGPCAPL